MGNRGGRFHLDGQLIGTRQWASKAWISCLLDFNDRPPRRVMAEGYTVLFFLDEATALAGGHRPCFQCRYRDAMRFARLFANGGPRARAANMDKRLHAERLGAPDVARAQGLPDGTIFQRDEAMFLAHQGKAHQWSFEGYEAGQPLPDEPVSVLTPASVRAVLSAGYAPLYHPSLWA